MYRLQRPSKLEALAPCLGVCYATSMKNTFFASLCSLCFIVMGCSDPGVEPVDELLSPFTCKASAPATRTVSCVELFEAGEGAGYGADQFPEIIYGEPLGNGDTQGGISVLSLGRGGSITIGFGSNAIVDGPDVDFTVFENPFLYGANGDQVFSELGEVSVSTDGETWKTFPCDAEANPPVGCAGYAPVFANGALGISSVDPAVSGGDQFDLATIGVTEEIRFVRIRDVQGAGAAPTAGFDLDGVAIVHAKIQ